jgi:hypothetical protein
VISRRALLGSLVGLSFGVKSAQAVSPNIGEIVITTPKKPQLDNKKWEELAAILLDKFFTHIVYSKFPRNIGPTVGDDIVFMQELITSPRFDWELPWLVQHYGNFWWKGVNDCLAKAGIKAIYTMMVTVRRLDNSILVTYHVIQGEKLPKPTKDEIGRAMARCD